MLVKLRIGRRLYASLEGVKGIDEEVDCKCCERTGLWLECQSKKLSTALRCMGCPARDNLQMLAGHTYKPDVGVRVRRHKTENPSLSLHVQPSSFPVQSSIIKSVE